MVSSSKDQQGTSSNILDDLLRLTDQIQALTEEEKATLLLAGISVLMRDTAQLEPTAAKATLKTIHDLSTEYLSRLR